MDASTSQLEPDSVLNMVSRSECILWRNKLDESSDDQPEWQAHAGQQGQGLSTICQVHKVTTFSKGAW